ncbi:hypothetical protein DDQ41_03660 [Streptomyces spongiicola]|uniref:Bacterial spore germination immunoglobulin-like domain-containing protein n=1 Tax=Streptomyces spongiicola TaxID=1690221 RepID=A0ABN5KI89_9ACTN|nr:hypothetical protein DDQ41_03660 [Streptomyces spongiicola]
MVDADGTVVRSQNIVSVTIHGTSDYVITVDPSIDMGSAVPIAVLRGNGAPGAGSPLRGKLFINPSVRPNSFVVSTRVDHDGDAVTDVLMPFNVIVP